MTSMSMAMWRLLDMYRSMTPTNEVLHAIKSYEDYLNVEFQDNFMRLVVKNAIADDYAPKRSYTFRLLRMYIQEVENAGEEISELLLQEMLTSLCNKQVIGFGDLDELYHVSYRIPRSNQVKDIDDVITCRVAAAHNEVGMKLWEAGFFLAEYALSHPEVFQNKRIVELGSGAGFTGLMMAAISGVAAEIVLTDYAPVVMQNLRYNIEVNSNRLKCPVEAMMLDWNTWNWTDREDSNSLDLLIAGDCVYDIQVFPVLMQVLGGFLNRKDKAAIFASTLRNETTFNAFLLQLQEHSIVYEDIMTNASIQIPQYFEYTNRDSIRLCRLTRSLS